MKTEQWVDDQGRQMVTFTFTVGSAHDGFRLDRYLKAQFKRMSRTMVQKILKEQVTINGARPTKPGILVRCKDSVVIQRPVPGEPEVPRSFEILAEDECFMAVDKPAGLPVHPTARFFHGTLTSVLRERYGPDSQLVPAHRLDRETSGILLVARGKQPERLLKEAFRRKTVHKVYLAVVHGEIKEPKEIDLPLGPSLTSSIRIKMGVRADGLAARTVFRPLAWGEASGRFTVIEASPMTGRQHQIRAHLEALGHPIVGDKIYGVPDEVFLRYIDEGMTSELMDRLLLPRHALHSYRITFPHPATGLPVTLQAPVPGDLVRFMSSLAPPAWPLPDST